jgi:hypothetical protein
MWHSHGLMMPLEEPATGNESTKVGLTAVPRRAVHAFPPMRPTEPTRSTWVGDEGQRKETFGEGEGSTLECFTCVEDDMVYVPGGGDKGADSVARCVNSLFRDENRSGGGGATVKFCSAPEDAVPDVVMGTVRECLGNGCELGSCGTSPPKWSHSTGLPVPFPPLWRNRQERQVLIILPT